MPRYQGDEEHVPTGAPGQRGMNPRVLMAIAFAIFALVSYFFKSQQNPITGEAQRVSLTMKDEVQLGLQAAPQMIEQHLGMHPDKRAQAHVNEVGQRLLGALDKWLADNGKQNPYPFKFHLLRDEKTINAFALPGGQVFITAALYAQLETDGQLAGVLGHEIGHVLERHGAQRMAKQELTQGLVGAAGVASGSQDGARMAQFVGQFVNMKYGRDDELESDVWGVRLCVLAGYDPHAMEGVMDILKASGGGRTPEIMSTHPDPGNRKERVQEYIEREFPKGLPDGLEP